MFLHALMMKRAQFSFMDDKKTVIGYMIRSTLLYIWKSSSLYKVYSDTGDKKHVLVYMTSDDTSLRCDLLELTCN